MAKALIAPSEPLEGRWRTQLEDKPCHWPGFKDPVSRKRSAMQIELSDKESRAEELSQIRRQLMRSSNHTLNPLIIGQSMCS